MNIYTIFTMQKLLYYRTKWSPEPSKLIVLRLSFNIDLMLGRGMGEGDGQGGGGEGGVKLLMLKTWRFRQTSLLCF